MHCFSLTPNVSALYHSRVMRDNFHASPDPRDPCIFISNYSEFVDISHSFHLGTFASDNQGPAVGLTELCCTKLKVCECPTTRWRRMCKRSVGSWWRSDPKTRLEKFSLFCFFFPTFYFKIQSLHIYSLYLVLLKKH